MRIDFDYNKKTIKCVEGYILKGSNYRANYTRFKTLYSSPAPGTETVEVYNFEPKKEVKASAILLHGLGSRNIKFLLWMGAHLASAGVYCSIPVIPGNYTRVENDSVSGRSFLYPEIRVMYKFWQHAVVDVMSTIDYLEQKKVWTQNNCIMGYCLGGMLSSIVASLDKRIDQVMFMTTGGYFPKIIHQSPAAGFARKLFKEDHRDIHYLYDKERLFETYERQLPSVRAMSLNELINNDEIHPLFKIDPLSYASNLKKERVTIIDALLDEVIPIGSRMSLLREMRGASRYILPMTHGSWLPFEILLAQYILYKVNIADKISLKQVKKKLKLDKDFFFNED
ncbi:dienelactone hydrolase family protein [Clostridium sp. YIM B02505]|uniref:Dienelactone hydrolase family protein n=1 Tax=Clostridium yunnanense TaxID=2800325 RepID=A0ABS1ENG5_9CLOT|nr:dienelactone hydrolase family protein [Clostridium yunnanense]MBK1810936.1 dienelactone hydrolase family protein [Clostridium yunnanense]